MDFVEVVCLFLSGFVKGIKLGLFLQVDLTIRDLSLFIFYFFNIERPFDWYVALFKLSRRHLKKLAWVMKK